MAGHRIAYPDSWPATGRDRPPDERRQRVRRLPAPQTRRAHHRHRPRGRLLPANRQPASITQWTGQSLAEVTTGPAMVSTADWTAATRWPHIATRSARDSPVATRSQNARGSAATCASAAGMQPRVAKGVEQACAGHRLQRAPAAPRCGRQRARVRCGLATADLEVWPACGACGTHPPRTPRTGRTVLPSSARTAGRRARRATPAQRLRCARGLVIACVVLVAAAQGCAKVRGFAS